MKLYIKSDSFDRAWNAEKLTDPVQLDRLAHQDRSINVRTSIANNPNTSEKTLKYLANDSRDKVKYCVAVHSNDIDTLTLLAENSINLPMILFKIIENPNCTEELHQYIINNVDDNTFENSVIKPDDLI